MDLLQIVKTYTDAINILKYFIPNENIYKVYL